MMLVPSKMIFFWEKIQGETINCAHFNIGIIIAQFICLALELETLILALQFLLKQRLF